ncbi:hypothetical protein TRFO_42106 [Tritrichomonas foetus]|uniref:Uncharacterized protein n=1 Tax=Tritrichomonas foetus TaxID=1144522 RepID=A0A1J4L266_9EUKA|nr:hypothetical protein TRFO_42106 [Tritrichomonas foetus]|eukprot:OHT16060.1 hypothetical protein TRFO_42106 [Tritrichomonas foetus]
MSILSGEIPPESEESRPAPKFGNLRQNSKARNRRDKVKFFDSADWAMRQQNQAASGESQEQQPQQDGVLHVSQISSIVDSEAPQGDNGNSSLISDSPMAQNGDGQMSILSGGNDNASPLIG